METIVLLMTAVVAVAIGNPPYPLFEGYPPPFDSDHLLLGKPTSFDLDHIEDKDIKMWEDYFDTSEETPQIIPQTTEPPAATTIEVEMDNTLPQVRALRQHYEQIKQEADQKLKEERQAAETAKREYEKTITDLQQQIEVLNQKAQEKTKVIKEDQHETMSRKKVVPTITWKQIFQKTETKMVIEYNSDIQVPIKEINSNLLSNDQASIKLFDDIQVPIKEIDSNLPSDDQASIKLFDGKLPSTCPPNFVNVKGGCYHFTSNTFSDWNGAAKKCLALNPRSSLASMETQEEWNNIKEYLSQNNLDIRSWLIAGTDQEKEGNWKWVATKQPIEYSGWCSGEPNNHNRKEDCIMIRGNKNLCWNDIPCDEGIMRYICEVYV